MSDSPTMLDEAALLARVQAPEGEGREILDAATREVIGRAPVQSEEELDAAVARAKAAQPAWDALGHAERSALLNAAADAIDANAEALARLLSREQGKPLNGPNARFEVGACSAWLRTNAATVLEPQVLVDDANLHAELVYKAAGVVGAISPWNWPMMISIWQIGPSLRMGNTVVIKPSSNTPLSVLALVSVMNEVLPADVLIAVSGPGAVGGRLAAHPDVAKVMFTGSTEVGRQIIESSAGNFARLTLELGGNDAGIVLPDTDVSAIADDLFWGAFINTGQTCAAMKRLYVHDSVYDEVVDALAEIAARTPMGPGLDERNEPLHFIRSPFAAIHDEGIDVAEARVDGAGGASDARCDLGRAEPLVATEADDLGVAFRGPICAVHELGSSLRVHRSRGEDLERGGVQGSGATGTWGSGRGVLNRLLARSGFTHDPERGAFGDHWGLRLQTQA